MEYVSGSLLQHGQWKVLCSFFFVVLLGLVFVNLFVLCVWVYVHREGKVERDSVNSVVVDTKCLQMDRILVGASVGLAPKGNNIVIRWVYPMCCVHIT